MNRHDGLKPVAEETPRRAKISGKAPHPEPPPEVLDRAIPFRTLPELLFDLDDLGAPPAARWMLRYLHDAAQGFGEPGTFRSMRRIARQTGRAITTVRQAIQWLIAHGFVARTTEVWGELEVEVKWCLWLLPTSHRRGRGGARFTSPGGARFTLPKVSNLLTQELKTTDEGASSSLAPQEGDPDGGTQADRPRQPGPAAAPSLTLPCPEPAAPVEIPPAPAIVPAPVVESAIPPAIAAAIESEVDDPADRAQIAARVAYWLTRATIENVIKLIVEGAQRRRARAQSDDPIGNLAGYCEGILNKSPRCQVTLRAGKSKLPHSGKTAPMVAAERQADEREKAEAAERQKAEAERQKAEAGHLKARWEALDPGERADIEATVRAGTPGCHKFKPMFEALCYAGMQAREAVPS